MDAQEAQSEPTPESKQGWRRLLQWRTLAILLIVVGLAVIALYGLRSFRAYREFQYIPSQGLDAALPMLRRFAPG